MRLHIVTPKAPIHVTVLPRVRAPGSDPKGAPVFLTGWQKPLKLPHNSVWVLRMPYIYCGEIWLCHVIQ